MSERLAFAKRSCSTWGAPPRGGTVVVTKNEAWWADDPFVKAHPDLFDDIPPDVRGRQAAEIEAATKAPGEKRRTTRRA